MGIRWRRLTIWLLLLQVLYYAIFITLSNPPFDLAGNPLASDLFSYLIGAHTVLDGDVQYLYDVSHQNTIQSVLLPDLAQPKYTYFVMPPPIAVIYAPLALLPYMGAVAVWLVISSVILLVAFRLAWSLRSSALDLRLRDVALIVLSIPCVFDVLYSGQSTGLWMLLMAGGLSFIARGRDASAGVLFGLGLLKPQLFLLFPILFLASGRYRAFLATVSTGLVLAIASIFIVGLDGVIDYLSLLRSDEYHYWNADLVSWKMISVPALLRYVTGYGVEPGIASSLLTAMPLIIAGVVTAWVGVKYKRDRSESDLTIAELTAFTIFTTFVLTPHVLLYDGLLLVVPIFLLAARVRSSILFQTSFIVAYLLAATTFLRVIMSFEAPAPVDLVAAPLTAIPIVGMWIAIARIFYARSASHELLRDANELRAARA